MKWKFWKREEDYSTGISATSIPMSTLFRWALYDLRVDYPNRFAEAVGFTPISEEGEEMEKVESDMRLEQLIPYVEFINTMSNINAEIGAETYASILSKYNLADEEPIGVEKEALAEIYKLMSMSTLITALSTALEIGILVNPGTYTSGYSMEDYFD